MENFFNITLGTIPVGIVVAVIGLLNRQAIKHLNQRIGRLEEGFNNHVKYHLKGKGFYNADYPVNYGLPPKNARKGGGEEK